MNKTAYIAIAVFFVLIAIFFAGLLAYSYGQIHVSLDDLRYHSIKLDITWNKILNLGIGALSGNWIESAFELIEEINLNLVFGLTNNGLVPVYIPDITYDLGLNGVSVGKGYSSIDVVINPGQTKQIDVFQNFEKNSLGTAISSIIRDKGMMNITVSGTAYFDFLGIKIPVPFESSKQISVIDEIKEKLEDEIQKNEH